MRANTFWPIFVFNAFFKATLKNRTESCEWPVSRSLMRTSRIPGALTAEDNDLAPFFVIEAVAVVVLDPAFVQDHETVADGHVREWVALSGIDATRQGDVFLYFHAYIVQQIHT